MSSKTIKHIGWPIAILLLLANTAVASPNISHITNSELITVKAVSGEERDLIVLLPESYHSRPKSTYPVLYFLDAHWDVSLMNIVYESMRLDNLVPDLILVGLSYPDSPENWPARRMRDYTPIADPALEGSGGGAQFLRFIHDQVIPLVESRYRANPAERALSGHSLGGLFALYTVFEKPELFKRVLALSPSALTGPGYLMSRESRFSKRNKSLDLRLFISFGVDEPDIYVAPILEFEEQLSARSYRDLTYKFKALPNMRHTSAKIDAYVNGLPWLFSDLAPRDETAFSGFLRRAYPTEPVGADD